MVESVFHRGQIPQSLATRFSDDLAVTLDAFSLESLSSNTPLPRSRMVLAWDGATNTANVQLTTTSHGVLPNGWYDGTWSDEALPLDAEHRTSFRFVLGDFDDDGAVSNQDIALFVDLLSGAATPPGVGPAVGDMDRDGVVTNQDVGPFITALTFGVRLPDPLAAPGQIATWALSDTSLRVNWTPPAEGTPDGYRVYRSRDGTNFQLAADLADPAIQPGGFFWDDAGLGQGTKYWYRVRPYTLATGNGHTTDKTWSCTVLPAPTVTAIEGGDGLIRVVWTDNADNATAFRITVRGSDDPHEVVTEETVPADLLSGAGNERSWLISGLARQQGYMVSVTALRGDGGVLSAASPAVDPVATGGVQSEPADSETYVAGFGVPTYAGVTWDITPDPTPEAWGGGAGSTTMPSSPAGAWQNQTVTIDLAGLPRHIFTKMHLGIDASTTGDVAEGLTFTVTAGTHTAVMTRSTGRPGSQAHWTLGETPLDGWVEHVGESMQIRITAEGFPTDGSGGAWSLDDFWLQTGLPVVSVVAEDALATEGADPPDTGSFRFERSGPRVDVALPIRYALSGTAVNGEDYEQLSGRHVFAPQQTSSLVEVVILEDDEVEPDEEVVATIAPSAAYQTVCGPVLLTAVSNDLRLDLTEADGKPEGRSAVHRLNCVVNQATIFRSVIVKDGNGNPVGGMGVELSAVVHAAAGGVVPMEVTFAEQWPGTFQVTIKPPIGTPGGSNYNIKVSLPQKYGRLAFTFIYIST